MLVFGVCAAGVGALYLAPSVTGTIHQVGLPRTDDRPSGGSSGRADNPVPLPAATGAAQSSDAPARTVRTTSTYPPTGRTSSTDSDRERRSPRGNTAFDPDEAKDEEPPSAVAAIKPVEVTAERLTLTWPKATDNDKVIGYRIWLNGFEVATTAETRVSLRWFNEDDGKHVVQVKAVDAAGNSSASSPTVLLTRPSPDPTASATPTPTPTDEPSPTEEPSPTTEPTGEPSAQATPNPTPTASEPPEDPE
jgi:hypothetical protein